MSDRSWRSRPCYNTKLSTAREQLVAPKRETLSAPGIGKLLNPSDMHQRHSWGDVALAAQPFFVGASEDMFDAALWQQLGRLEICKLCMLVATPMKNMRQQGEDSTHDLQFVGRVVEWWSNPAWHRHPVPSASIPDSWLPPPHAISTWVDIQASSTSIFFLFVSSFFPSHSRHS